LLAFAGAYRGLENPFNLEHGGIIATASLVSPAVARMEPMSFQTAIPPILSSSSQVDLNRGSTNIDDAPLTAGL
jgi:hypothetical protein